MEAIYNGKSLFSETVSLKVSNRAFAYGDGLFETILYHNGNCPLLTYHFERLSAGCKVLQMELPFKLDQLQSYIQHLAGREAKHLPLRLRLQVWRKEGGLYTPESQESEFLLTAAPYTPAAGLKRNAGFAETIHLSYSPFSSLKTMSALPYVLAGLEKKKRQLDELILTDAQGHIAECSIANIFWLKGDKWYTPHLTSGCIAGVMRRHLLNALREKDIAVQEVLQSKEQLLQADSIISCNATGLFSIMQIENKQFHDSRPFLSDLIPLPVL